MTDPKIIVTLSDFRRVWELGKALTAYQLHEPRDFGAADHPIFLWDLETRQRIPLDVTDLISVGQLHFSSAGDVIRAIAVSRKLRRSRLESTLGRPLWRALASGSNLLVHLPGAVCREQRSCVVILAGGLSWGKREPCRATGKHRGGCRGCASVLRSDDRNRSDTVRGADYSFGEP